MTSNDEPGRLTSALLGAPAPHAVRVIASALLDDVVAAHGRFADGEAEGLHDLRVAIRRLRSWMRAFRPELSDTVRGKSRRRLHALASASNEARDGEVTLAFIERQTDLPSRARATLRAEVGVLEKARDDAARELKRTLHRDLAKATSAIATQLESWWERHRLTERAPVSAMSAVFADAVRHQTRRMQSALERVEPPGTADDVHRARIAVKRLRYLLEPLDVSFDAAGPVRQLQALQRQLGDMRDAQRIAARFVREIGERTARDARTRALASLGLAGGDDGPPRKGAPGRAGLRELARRATAAREQALAEYSAQWSDAEVAALVERVDDIARKVEAG